MELREGAGNAPGQRREGDRINVVYVLDSTAHSFHRAELYHQFHDGIGHPFPSDYKQASTP